MDRQLGDRASSLQDQLTSHVIVSSCEEILISHVYKNIYLEGCWILNYIYVGAIAGKGEDMC